jgi:branched-chain amino acid transport system permease protein
MGAKGGWTLARLHQLFPILKEKARTQVQSLSGGQQQMVAIGRAMMAKPRLLLLDEPAAGLRRLEKQTLSDLLRGLRAEGMTIVLVEHDMEFVMNLVDRIVVVDFGAKLAEGVPATIRADARVQEAYLGGVA